MKKIKILFICTLMLLITGCTDTASDRSMPEDDAALSSSSMESENSNTSTTSLSADSNHAAGETITVNSSEQVSVAPDIAQVVYSVRSSHSDAAQCQQQNNDAVSEVVELLISLHIEESSIQTTDYYMNPVYNYSGSTPRLTGYQATTTLTVSDIPIDELGSILSGSVASGINSIQSVTYQTSSYDEGYEAALIQAMNSARQKAQALADAAGCQLGAVVSITELSGYSDARYTDYSLTRGISDLQSAKMMAEDSAVMAGEIDVKASIVVEYQLLK